MGGSGSLLGSLRNRKTEKETQQVWIFRSIRKWALIHIICVFVYYLHFHFQIMENPRHALVVVMEFFCTGLIGTKQSGW